MIFDSTVNMLTTQDIIKLYIDEFNASQQRQLMFVGEQYYKTDNDILKRKMMRYENEVAVLDETKTNNRLAHGFMHILVDDKVNYLLTKPYTMTCKNEKYLELVQATLGKRFQKQLSKLGTQASNKGIAWLHAYINKNGEFKTRVIPSEEIIALWLDNDHEELQAVIRYYDQEYYEGKDKKIRTKIEYWTEGNVEYYLKEDGVILEDSEAYLDDANNYEGHFKAKDMAYSWGKVPFIAFKNNDMELPDIKFIKTLIDNYDLSRSDVANLLEDVKNIIMVLRGYGGENLSDFMRDLAYYKAVKIDDVADGGVDNLNNTIDIAAATAHVERLFKDVNTFGQGVDKDPAALGSAPSGEALKFLYSGLDLKCNAIEDNFKFGFEELVYFINEYLEVTNQAVSNDEIELIFNRDIMIRESATINDCKNSIGVISKKTIAANHPWVDNLEEEIKQMEEEEPDIEDDTNYTDDSEQQATATTSLNGSQITSLLKVVQSVVDGTITRAAAISIITSTLGISEENASKFIEEQKALLK